MPPRKRRGSRAAREGLIVPGLPPPELRGDQAAGTVSSGDELPRATTADPAADPLPRATAADPAADPLNRRAPPQLPPPHLPTGQRKENKELEEAENEIRMLNELGLGEEISSEEYRGYLEQLPPEPPCVDIFTKLDSAELKELQARHALYRIRFHKLSQQVPESELRYDKLKEDYPLSLLEKEDFFERYQDKGIIDWSFHPDYCQLAALEDYQRIVPRNYGGHEYVDWDAYHKDFYSYDVEQEYIKFCEELSKKLKWIEAYVPNKTPSLKWERILDRGTYQAAKIATGFSMITGSLAFSGFYEWLHSMSLDVCCYNEYDGVYYEIWHRITKQKKSFRAALDEVYTLNKFPLRQHEMKCALENAKFCSMLEKNFLLHTACVTEEVTEDKARELIAEALRKEMEKPKFYEQYCRKKIDIARAIRLISRA